MMHSLVTLYSEVGNFTSFEQNLLVEHDQNADAKDLVEKHLIKEYGEVEQPLHDGTIVFEGHKNGDSIIITFQNIMRVSPEEAEVLKRFIPSMERE